jgi:succinate dehydrogenase/fumarate reductase flavoprotein subunit
VDAYRIIFCMTELDADVLVLGGGPAGIWAALAAKAGGARVVLADKGHCGASGPASRGVTKLWTIAPGQARTGAMGRWTTKGVYLSEPDWMDRVMDDAYRRVNQLVEWGYPFPRLAGAAAGSGRLTALGPDLWLALRRRAVRAGVRVLDCHPALQLLVDADGVVAGASGIALTGDCGRWRVRAGAVVLATGGCAFLSGSAGTEGNTGDGHLMAAEVGAEMSGMEFSAAYALASSESVGADRDAHGPMLSFATFYDGGGDLVAQKQADGGHLTAVFSAIANGRQVYAKVDNAPPLVRETLRRSGCDPGRPVPLRPVLEGTVRGTGGLRVASAECGTSVAGLYAAGDVASREAVAGAAGGYGGVSGAWAMASGAWAGSGAARFARDRPRVGRVNAVPGAGLSPFGQVNPYSVIGLVQEHTVPLRRSYWRSQAVLRDSLSELDGMWPGAMYGLGGVGPTLMRAREAAAMLAVARWATNSALVRTESRGIHRRLDHPDDKSRWQLRLLAGGLDNVWVRTTAIPA